MSRRLHITGFVLALGSLLASGCTQHQQSFNFQNADMAYFREVATQIDTPDVDSLTLDEVTFAHRPLSLANYEEYEFWEISLEEAVHTALANSKVVRQLNYGAAPSEGGAVVAGASEALLRSPDSIRSVYDPSLQETSTGGGFGGIGVEAALAAFDAQVSSSVTWNRNERPVNTGGIGQAIFATNFNQDLGAYTSQLSKQSAVGTSFFARHNVNYELNNNPTRGVPSDWQTNLEFGFNQPLLQGWGTQFNRVAGPNSAPGFYRGVAIARINNDITLADFEAGVRDQTKSVEDAYWELYMAYRAFDSSRKRRDGVLVEWNRFRGLFGDGGELVGGGPLAQARAEFFRSRAQMENSLNQVFRAEKRLRYLMGLAAADGRLIRPCDEPTAAPWTVDWHDAQCEMLARTVELRKQKWRVKQRELELRASKNFLLPRLDAQGTYRVLGAGDDLVDPGGRGVFPFPGSNAFSTLTDGDYQEWQLGLNLSWNLGFRTEHAGVRNAQLQLARTKAQLQEQELEASHLLSESIGNLESNYELLKTQFNVWQAAQEDRKAQEGLRDSGLGSLPSGEVLYRPENLLSAIVNEAVAESNYYRALVNFNRSIADVHFRKGSLLDYNNVYLAEGPWPGKAYQDAKERALLRANAKPLDYVITRPEVFSRGPHPQITDAPLPPDHGWFLDAEEIPTPAAGQGTGQPGDLPPPVDMDDMNAGLGSFQTADGAAEHSVLVTPIQQQVTPVNYEQEQSQNHSQEKDDLLFRDVRSSSKVESGNRSLNQASERTRDSERREGHEGAANPTVAHAG